MPPRKLGAFKRAMAHIDEHWFKKLLVKMTDEEIRAADDVEEMMQEVLDEEPEFATVAPMFRKTLEA